MFSPTFTNTILVNRENLQINNLKNLTKLNGKKKSKNVVFHIFGTLERHLPLTNSTTSKQKKSYQVFPPIFSPLNCISISELIQMRFVFVNMITSETRANHFFCPTTTINLINQVSFATLPVPIRDDLIAQSRYS